MSGAKHEHLMNALGAALAAGEAILEVYAKPHVRRELKDDATPVTEADRAAHSRISEILLPLGMPVLSEEGRKIGYSERRDWETFWLVDPLDGTKEFLRRNGEFTVNIAMIRQNKAVAGVLYAPLHDLMYFAAPGSGAFRVEEFKRKWPGIREFSGLLDMAQSLPLEGVPSKLPEGYTTPVPEAEASQSPGNAARPYRVVASRSHRNRPTRRYIRILKKMHPGLEMVSRGSALKFCLVAEGFADIYPRFGPTWEWDTAAGQAIAEAAGCTVTLHDLQSPLSYNKEVLLNPWFIVKRD
jgi:3'(2'), 5'-bisphosphate nucleotidase